MHEVAAEFYMVGGRPEDAIAEIEKAAALPFIDLAWLDGCPLLEPVRQDPRFAAVRATTAARVAVFWG
jgi:serine/threonine-protein kinase